MPLIAMAAGVVLAGPGHAQAVQGECLDGREESSVSPALSWSTDAFCVKAWGLAARYTLGERGYLGREFEDSGVQQLDVLQPGRHLTGSGWGIGFTYVNPRFEGVDSLNFDAAIFSMNIASLSVTGETNWATYDPGVGHLMLLPGQQGGASGAALGFNPLNVLQDVRYGTNLGWTGGDLNVGLRRNQANGTAGFELGVMHSSLHQDETLTGSIPGFLSDFQYHHELQTRATGVHVGVRREFVLSAGDSAWETRLAGRVRAGMASVSAHMNAALSFDGFLEDFVPASDNFAKQTSTRAYGGVGASISATDATGRFRVFADLAYDLRPWGAAVVYDGTNPSQLQTQSMGVVTASLGVQFRF